MHMHVWSLGWVDASSDSKLEAKVRLEAVATPDDVASEEADILEQRRLNGELLDNY